MKQRVQMAMEGETGILVDLRHTNQGAPGNTYDVFWKHMGSLLDEVKMFLKG